MDKAPEWPKNMTLTQARKYLGISFAKLTSLVRGGQIPFEKDPLDNRVKLVKRSDLDRLRRQGHRSRPQG
jgi:hypothetical protein